jgi:methionyl-tRNA formyltransferase
MVATLATMIPIFMIFLSYLSSCARAGPTVPQIHGGIKGSFFSARGTGSGRLDAFPLLYLGIPLGALRLLSGGHHIAAACVSRQTFPGMRRLRVALARAGAPVFARPDLEDAALLGMLRSTRPALVVSCFWHRRIPDAVRRLGRLGAVGVHPSLLPRHRGADPVFWALHRGDATTGVSVHRLDDAYDAGPILATRSVVIDAAWNAHALAHVLDGLTFAALADVCGRLAAGEVIPEVAQDDAAATQAPEPTEDDLEIRWSSSSGEILRLVRAAAPAPGAFSRHDDRTLTVVRASPTALRLEPGVAAIVAEGVVVGTADFAVRLDAVRVDDDDAVLSGPAVAAAVPGASDLRGTR